MTDRAGASLRFNAAHPQAAGVVAAAPGLHGALMGGLAPPVERPEQGFNGKEPG